MAQVAGYRQSMSTYYNAAQNAYMPVPQAAPPYTQSASQRVTSPYASAQQTPLPSPNQQGASMFGGPQVPLRPLVQMEHRTIQSVLDAVRCFFQAINLCRGSRLQDTLR